MSNSTYHITDRTDIGEVSIITIAERVCDSLGRPLGGGQRYWTLVAHADGWDSLVGPGGQHFSLDPSGNDRPAVLAVLGWVADNV
jgi:hypothetical protein